jgi:D-alanyl-D-alanine carboxypeptidase (penicillin-binding protein 5/6)
MIVQSGNDACIALAELIAGSEEAFAQRTAKQRLSMKNTNFMNSTGLPNVRQLFDGSRSGAACLAIVRDFPNIIRSTR